MEYAFTLKYRVDKDSDQDALVERLGEAGCTDAVVGLGKVGRLALAFVREADSAFEAVRSALAEVKAAVPDAKLVEAAPDFVGLTDVAEIVGVSRQNLRQLMMSYESFPSPVHEGSASIWHLAELLVWLAARPGYQIEPRTLEIAKATLKVNLAKEACRASSDPGEDLERLVA